MASFNTISLRIARKPWTPSRGWRSEGGRYTLKFPSRRRARKPHNSPRTKVRVRRTTDDGRDRHREGPTVTLEMSRRGGETTIAVDEVRHHLDIAERIAQGAVMAECLRCTATIIARYRPPHTTTKRACHIRV